MEKVIDNYKEHEFHPKPFWKNMKTCSTCFSKHNEVVKRFRSKGGNSYQRQFNSPSEAGIAI